jgi:hypothetical protein
MEVVIALAILFAIWVLVIWARVISTKMSCSLFVKAGLVHRAAPISTIEIAGT